MTNLYEVCFLGDVAQMVDFFYFKIIIYLSIKNDKV